MRSGHERPWPCCGGRGGAAERASSATARSGMSWKVEGAYEGLTTFFHYPHQDGLQGVIMPSDLPAFGEPIAPPTDQGTGDGPPNVERRGASRDGPLHRHGPNALVPLDRTAPARSRPRRPTEAPRPRRSSEGGTSPHRKASPISVPRGERRLSRRWVAGSQPPRPSLPSTSPARRGCVVPGSPRPSGGARPSLAQSRSMPRGALDRRWTSRDRTAVPGRELKHHPPAE